MFHCFNNLLQSGGQIVFYFLYLELWSTLVSYQITVHNLGSKQTKWP